MFYRAISVVLVAVLVHGSVTAQVQPQSATQTAAKMQQILRKAQEKNKTVKVILSKRIYNQTELSGKVNDISDTGFVLTDQKTGETRRLAYEDVQQVKQKGMSKRTKILIVSAVVVGAMIGLGFAIACSSEGGPHC